MSILSRLATLSGTSGITYIGVSKASVPKSTPLVINKPSGVQEGDLLVAFMLSPANGTTYTCAGWAVASVSDSVAVMYKLAAASEASSYTFVATNTEASSGFIVAYRNAALDVIGTASNLASAPIAPAITLAANKSTLLGLYWAYNVSSCTFTTPPGFSAIESDSDATAPSWAVFSKTGISSGSTGTTTSTGSSGSTSRGLLVGLKPFSYKAIPFIASASTQNSSSGGTLVINKPTGTLQGDLMLAFMGSDGGNGTWTGDTSWTEVADHSNNPPLRVAYKIAGASEPSSYTFSSIDTGRKHAGSILTYRGATYDAVGLFETTAPGSVLRIPSVTASVDSCRLVAVTLRANSGTTITASASMIARVADADATAPSYAIADEIVASGATGTRAFTLSSSTNNVGIGITIKPV